MTSGIYRIRNNRTGKEYIGQSKNIEKRFKQHQNQLKKRKHSNKGLQSDYNRGHSFSYEIIQRTSSSDRATLDRLEESYIKKRGSKRNGYNRTYGGRTDKYASKQYRKSHSKSSLQRPLRRTVLNPTYAKDHTENIRYFGDNLKINPKLREHNEKIKEELEKRLNAEIIYVRKERKNWSKDTHLKNPRYYGDNLKINPRLRVINEDDKWIKCPKCGKINHHSWLQKYGECYYCSTRIIFKDESFSSKKSSHVDIVKNHSMEKNNIKSGFKASKIQTYPQRIEEKLKNTEKPIKNFSQKVNERTNLNNNETNCDLLNDSDKKTVNDSNKNLFSKKICPNCKKENDSSDKFCIYCGTPIGKQLCPNCQNEVRPTDNFCTDCGTKLIKSFPRRT